MNPAVKNRLIDAGVACVAVLGGAAVVHFGDRLVDVRLEYFFGVDTFSMLWVVDLFLVPCIAGILVSFVYGLGGKILAHLSPVIVRVMSYYEVQNFADPLPDGVVPLPMSYWLLVVVISAEFAAVGGLLGEIFVKRTYGRTPKELLHKRYMKPSLAQSDEEAKP